LVIVTTTGSEVVPPRTGPKSWLATETSRSRPVPFSAPDTSVGPFVAISRFAVCAPVADGSKVTSTRHVCPVVSGAAALHASSAIANCPAPAPVSARPVTVSGSVPVLVSVSARAVAGPASTCRLLKFWAVDVSVAVTSASAVAGAATSNKAQRSNARRTPRGAISGCIGLFGERLGRAFGGPN
jgi:hypothetical protein